MKNIISAIVLFVVSAAAQAGLLLHVSPDGLGGTRWQFEGSTTALASSSVNSFWGEGSGTLVASQVGSYGITFGGGTLSSTSGGTLAVADVWASQHTYDGLAPRVASSLSWLAGDILSWSGDLLSDLPFSQLILGSVIADNILFGVPLSDTITITVSDHALNGVPEPSSMALLGVAFAGLSFARKKKLQN